MTKIIEKFAYLLENGETRSESAPGVQPVYNCFRFKRHIWLLFVD